MTISYSLLQEKERQIRIPSSNTNFSYSEHQKSIIFHESLTTEQKLVDPKAKYNSYFLIPFNKLIKWSDWLGQSQIALLIYYGLIWIYIQHPYVIISTLSAEIGMITFG